MRWQGLGAQKRVWSSIRRWLPVKEGAMVLKQLTVDNLKTAWGTEDTEEALIKTILFERRIQFLFKGMRWFDIKRYGIEIHRRTVNGLAVNSVDDELKVRDNRRALQLPQDVIKAGIIANPR